MQSENPDMDVNANPDMNPAMDDLMNNIHNTTHDLLTTYGKLIPAPIDPWDETVAQLDGCADDLVRVVTATGEGQV